MTRLGAVVAGILDRDRVLVGRWRALMMNGCVVGWTGSCILLLFGSGGCMLARLGWVGEVDLGDWSGKGVRETYSARVCFEE